MPASSLTAKVRVAAGRISDSPCCMFIDRERILLSFVANDAENPNICYDKWARRSFTAGSGSLGSLRARGPMVDSLPHQEPNDLRVPAERCSSVYLHTSTFPSEYPTVGDDCADSHPAWNVACASFGNEEGSLTWQSRLKLQTSEFLKDSRSTSEQIRRTGSSGWRLFAIPTSRVFGAYSSSSARESASQAARSSSMSVCEACPGRSSSIHLQKFAPLPKAGFQVRINENSHHGFTTHVERQDPGTISLRAAAKPWMRV